MSYTVTVNPPTDAFVGKPGWSNLSFRTAEVEENLPFLAKGEKVNHFETTQYGQTAEGYSLTWVSWRPTKTTF
jgi:hypothetical protein